MHNAAFEKLIHHLDAHELKYSTGSDGQTIFVDFRGEVGTYRIVATAEEETSLFQVFGYSPVFVPLGARPAIAETMTRANHCLRMGKWEFDLDHGDLRFQVSQVLVDGDLDDVVIHRLFSLVMSMLDTYLPAVLSVIYGNELPKDAIQVAEGRSSDVGGTEREERKAE